MAYSASAVLPESRFRHSLINIRSHNLSFKIPISRSQESHLSGQRFCSGMWFFVACRAFMELYELSGNVACKSSQRIFR